LYTVSLPQISEPEFVNILGAQESIPPDFIGWRERDRFEGSLNVYKFGLRLEEKSFTSSSNICQEVCCTVDRRGQEE
jgi:hypothetical protein